MGPQDKLEAMRRLWMSSGSGGWTWREQHQGRTPRHDSAKASPTSRLIFKQELISL